MTVDIYGLAHEIHSTAKEKGFWDEERNTGEMLMLIISELAEALEEHRDGREVIYYVEGGKPEGTAIELADAVIRCLDTLYAKWHSRLGGMQIFYEDQSLLQCSENPLSMYKIDDNFGENLLKAVDLAVRGQRNILFLVDCVIYCERLCETLGVDIWHAARVKMDYNTTRPYKHGKAY